MQQILILPKVFNSDKNLLNVNENIFLLLIFLIINLSVNTTISHIFYDFL